MIDKKLVYRKINLIAKDLQKVKPISLLSQKEYFKKIDYEILTERYLERIITRMIDINYHLIVESGNPPPKDYFSSFVELEKMEVLSYDFSRKLAQYAGLRNRLVHEYNELDEKKVYKALKQSLKDIPKYLRSIEDFIEKKKLKKLL
jgi:uncharacterized protein YutE (UPF0331/DUF86 family)